MRFFCVLRVGITISEGMYLSQLLIFLTRLGGPRYPTPTTNFMSPTGIEPGFSSVKDECLKHYAIGAVSITLY